MKRILTLAALVAMFAIGCNSDAKKAEQYKKNGDWTNAQEYYLKAIKADPKNARLHNELGFVYEKRKYYELAEAEYRKAIQFNGGFLEAKYNLGSVMYKMSRYNEAAQEFEYVVKNDNGNAKAKNALALSLQMSQGDKNRALDLYKQAIKLDPNNATFHANLAALYEEMGEKAKAEEELKKAAALGATNTPKQK